MPTAILIDGEFFLKRYRYLNGSNSPDKVARDLRWMCHEHLKDGYKQAEKHERKKLYRIFFYDCPPLTKYERNPISKRGFKFADTDTAVWRIAFHDELRKLRKTALRLGYLNDRQGRWIIKPDKLKALLDRKITVDDLTEEDVRYDIKQMGVDMRIGLDIASMAYKKQVDQMILVAGDSDFVPAAKLARREGIDFILDPMWSQIRPDLHEHIDGKRCVFRKRPSDAEKRAEAVTNSTTQEASVLEIKNETSEGMD